MTRHRRRPLRPVLLLSAALTLASCMDPMITTLDDVVRTENTPGGSSVPPDGSQIGPTDRIRIRFSEPMREGSAEVAISPEGLSFALSWESTLEPSDTLVLAPVSPWPLHKALALAVTASSSQGLPSRLVEATLDVVGADIYVSAGRGDDSAPGSPDAPFRTISAALDRAQARRVGGFAGQQTVHVAAGRYEESVALVTDVSLFGGYEETFESRTPGTSVLGGDDEPDYSVYIPTWDEGLFDAVLDGFTVEEPPGNAAGSAVFGGNYGRVLVRNVSITADSVPAVSAWGALTVILENVTVRGPGLASTAIYAEGPELILRNSEVSMADVTGGQTFRIPTIWLDGAVCVIDRSTVLGPDGEIGESVAILVDDADLTVDNSLIDGGGGGQVRGIRSNRGEVTVRNSTLRVGTASGGAPDAAVAVEARFYLENESTGDLSQRGLEGLSGNGLNVENSIIFGSGQGNSAGIVHGDLPLVRNNIFHDLAASTVYRDTFDNPQTFTATALNDETDLLIGAADNVDTDPSIASALSLRNGSADWRLTAGSPAKAREGAYDLSGAGVAPVDAAGEPRTAPWSIGAYEYE